MLLYYSQGSQTPAVNDVPCSGCHPRIPDAPTAHRRLEGKEKGSGALVVIELVMSASGSPCRLELTIIKKNQASGLRDDIDEERSVVIFENCVRKTVAVLQKAWWWEMYRLWWVEKGNIYLNGWPRQYNILPTYLKELKKKISQTQVIKYMPNNLNLRQTRIQIIAICVFTRQLELHIRTSERTGLRYAMNAIYTHVTRSAVSEYRDSERRSPKDMG